MQNGIIPLRLFCRPNTMGFPTPAEVGLAMAIMCMPFRQSHSSIPAFGGSFFQAVAASLSTVLRSAGYSLLRDGRPPREDVSC